MRIYYTEKGYYQKKANKLFKQITDYGIHHEYDNKSKYLKELEKTWRFYRIVIYYFYDSYSFKEAVKIGRQHTLYKGNCESLSQLEDMMDDLVLKAYDEQRKLKKI